MSKTSFAVLTKARSKFGNRLTEKDYQSLLACQSVGEIMSYLKNNTHYSKALTMSVSVKFTEDGLRLF